MKLELPRRSFIAGLGALVAAPTIVKVASLMPVKSTLVPEPLQHLDQWTLDDLTERVLRPSLDLLERQIVGNVLFGIDQIAREAVLFTNGNSLLRKLEAEGDR